MMITREGLLSFFLHSCRICWRNGDGWCGNWVNNWAYSLNIFIGPDSGMLGLVLYIYGLTSCAVRVERGWNTIDRWQLRSSWALNIFGKVDARRVIILTSDSRKRLWKKKKNLVEPGRICLVSRYNWTGFLLNLTLKFFSIFFFVLMC